MKWLILQSAGEHDGSDGWEPNHFLRECFAVADALKRLGQTVTIHGPRHNNFAEYNPIDFDFFNSFDVVFVLENWEEYFLPSSFVISKVKPVFIYWAIDVHVRGINFYEDLTKDYDIVLHSTSDFIPHFNPTRRHYWFPNAVDDRYFNQTIFQFPKDGDDFLFIGKDRPFLQGLKQTLGLKHYKTTGMDMIQKLGRAKIGFNHNIGADINYRTFETIGLGTCLVTDINDNLDTLGFVNGKNCITYSYYDELFIIIPTLLQSGQWQSIGASGYELSKNHTYLKRMEKLLTLI